MSQRAGLPVIVHFYNGRGNDGHLYFTCPGYRPFGKDPGYKRGPYNPDSDLCLECRKTINRVFYRAPWCCHKYYRDSTVIRELRKDLRYAMHLLFPDEKPPQDEGMKKQKKPKRIVIR